MLSISSRVSSLSQTKSLYKNVQNKPYVSQSIRSIEDKFNDGESETSEVDNAAYTMEHIGAVGSPKSGLLI